MYRSGRCASRDSINQNASVVEWFSRLERAVSEVYVVKFSIYSKLVYVISALYSRGKLLEHFILIAVALLLNIVLSWAFVTSLDCSVMCKPPWLFECYFGRSSWIHSWLLVAVLSDYFGQPVTSTFRLCKFRGLPGSTSVSFPVMARRRRHKMKKSSQPSSPTPGKRAEKLAEAKTDVKQVTQNAGRVCFILNQKR